MTLNIAWQHIDNFPGGNMLNFSLLSLFSFMVLIHTVGHAGDMRIDGSGYSGGSGSNGSSGWYPTRGQDGGDGVSGDDMSLRIDESDNTLTITGTVGQENIQKSFEFSGGTLKLDTSGGNGGDGGRGGYGSDGTSGTDGRSGRRGNSGRRGRNGRNGSRHSPDGQNGGPGGPGQNGSDGTHGTDGSNGVSGASGGSGGDAGSGGAIEVSFTNPGVLMHLKTSYSGGVAGSKGYGGSGGSGGRAGAGGRGGPGGMGGEGGRGGYGYRCSTQERQAGCRDGRNGHSGSRGNKGRRGRHGRDGSSGRDGQNGFSGSYGSSGSAGSLKLVHLDESDNVLATYDHLNIYNLIITDFEFVDENEDGIFEPGERVKILSLTLENNGGMDMPSGAVLNFGDHSVEGPVSVALPIVRKGQVIQVRRTFYLTLPRTLQLNERFSMEMGVSFRGLFFNSSFHSESIIAKYPLLVENVTYENAIPYEKDFKAKITIKNISSKDYHSGKISYQLDGQLDYETLLSLPTVLAGATSTEVVGYKASDILENFERSTLSFQVSRDGNSYQSQKMEIQVVPGYVFHPESQFLILSHGHEVETFKALNLALVELGFSGDIYDLRINGAPSLELLARYQKKGVIFNGHPDGVTPASLSQDLSYYASHGGGIWLSSLGLNVTNADYKNPLVETSQSLFSLSGGELNTYLKENLLKTFVYKEKEELLKSYFDKGETHNTDSLKAAYLYELKKEYQLSGGQSSIYTSGNSLVQKYTMSLNLNNPVLNYKLRNYKLNFVPTLLTFKNHPGDWDNFSSKFSYARKDYNDISKVQQTCEDLEGQFVANTGELLYIDDKIRNRFKGKMPSRDLEFKKGKLKDELLWRFKYKVDDEKHYAHFKMTCESDRILIQTTLPHNDEELVFIKTRIDD
jgi:hypothetical protein